MNRVVNCILCGGAGTRLWPLSRQKMPKQFIPLFQGRSLFQDTVRRNAAVCDEIMVISNVDMLHLAKQQMEKESQQGRFLLEPIGRNTAPALGLGAMLLSPDDIVVVTTSDHVIVNTVAFEQAVEEAVQLAKEGSIVTFGIQPTHPETGFGYIEHQGQDVVQFKEKPDAETAQAYLDAGNFLWNSGMFCFKASVFLEELAAFAPEMYAGCVEAMKQGATHSSDGTQTTIDLGFMKAIPALSVDYAVMEHSQKIKVIPCDLGWSDLGSYDALYEEFSDSLQDVDGNVCLKEDITPSSSEQAYEPLLEAAKGNLVVSSERQIALVGVEDLLVVDTPDALLIGKRGASQKVSTVAKALKQQQSPLMQTHTTTYRPWGAFQNLLEQPGYKVKRIIVNPGQKLSLQRHQHRAEHWTVVEGDAWVRNGDSEFLLGVSESTFIPQGAIHRLENRTEHAVVLIEVQTGSYTGEDDIERLEDIYGRTGTNL